MGLFEDKIAKPAECFIDGKNSKGYGTQQQFNDSQFKTAIMRELRKNNQLLDEILTKLTDIDFELIKKGAK